MGQRVRVVLLAEDRTLERVAVGILAALGVRNREITTRPYVVARNAKLWVTEQYHREVDAFRSRAAFQKDLALVVATDADQQSVIERTRVLDDSLVAAQLVARVPNERVILWIPKWHIETWIAWSLGYSTTEDAPDAHHVDRLRWKPAEVGSRFVEEYRKYPNNVGQDVPPSMVTAFAETNRFP